ncbi:MAG: diaminopimelate decarboxylase [Burkholderiales bacterium]|jgi:diaminopimelate decarboxylase|nr:diaminopimelate decarboxylase [Burkholderiales bacterium]
MTAFALRDGELFAERVSLAAIAERHGTPCYVYSRASLEGAWRSLDSALAGLPHLVCYAVKANSTLAVLDVFARLGGGFDIVSGGELARVVAAGGDPRRTVFSGVGKSAAEMRAALEADILCFNVESEGELERLDGLARATGRRAPVSLRVNPDVDPKTHPYISTGLKESKFGIPYADAPALYRRAAAMPGIAIRGIDMHIGSQITELGPYREAASKLLGLVDRLAADGLLLEHVDVGGGLGVRYRDEVPVPVADYAALLRELFSGRREKLVLEPGRWLVANAGVLLTRVEYLKRGPGKRFAIVDAAMNDLIRPALYDAWHAVEPVRPRGDVAERWDLVGPVCESADFLALDRALALAPGDLLAIRSAGAYAMAMSSNYNTRPRAAEVMVDGDRAHVVRRRESVDELFASETPLPR